MEKIKNILCNEDFLRYFYGVTITLFWILMITVNSQRRKYMKLVKQVIEIHDEAKYIQIKTSDLQQLIMAKEFYPGSKVAHVSPNGDIENGIIKEICDDPKFMFVVFNCNDDWDNYKDYTGQRCSIYNLVRGWRE
jgi:hypothetical protein